MGIRLSDISPRRRRETVEFVPWRLVQPQGDESCRWQCSDGRWVALTLGHGEEIGSVILTGSSGQRERVDSYEDALALARAWRT